VTNWRMAGLGAMALAALVSTSGEGQGQAQRRALPGDLARPIGAYTGNQFFALVNGLNYTGGQERARRCGGDPACVGPNGIRTNVRIDAVATEDSIAASNVPQFGVVAARAIVRGNNTEAMYGMLPNGPTGRYSYYLIVIRGNTAGSARWILEELSVVGTTRTHRTIRTGTFTPCANHTWQPGARADFRSCQQPAALAPRGGVMFINASFESIAQGVDPPIWIGCASGCCLADGS
jgi:hypothetical protein